MSRNLSKFKQWELPPNCYFHWYVCVEIGTRATWFSTFSLQGPLHYPWVLSVVFKCFANIRITDQIAFLCVHAPRVHIYLRFLPSLLPSATKTPTVMLHIFAYAEIIFAHILVFPACAIEVQNIDENSPTGLHMTSRRPCWCQHGRPVTWLQSKNWEKYKNSTSKH